LSLKRNLDEIGYDPGIYFLHSMDGCLLYVGKASNVRARIEHHKANYDIVKPWLSFFDHHFETLNFRIWEAVKKLDDVSFQALSALIAWPLAIIDSTLAIDCAFGSVDMITTEGCFPEELNWKECTYIRLLKPPFNYQYNKDLAGFERWKYFPRDYLKSKALSNLMSHHSRILTMRMLG
jgi:hypothetical protein